MTDTDREYAARLFAGSSKATSEPAAKPEPEQAALTFIRRLFNR